MVCPADPASNKSTALLLVSAVSFVYKVNERRWTLVASKSAFDAELAIGIDTRVRKTQVYASVYTIPRHGPVT